ncbi:hypothetical protein Tco_0842465 [Tanacetum coccineum]|uniref:Uncharacterized protein n=1 Tax=Tanacetum coccineum TaxID=301880 RepID=A0ABQ5B0J7_9ASTR
MQSKGTRQRYESADEAVDAWNVQGPQFASQVDVEDDMSKTVPSYWCLKLENPAAFKNLIRSPSNSSVSSILVNPLKEKTQRLTSKDVSGTNAVQDSFFILMTLDHSRFSKAHPTLSHDVFSNQFRKALFFHLNDE